MGCWTGAIFGGKAGWVDVAECLDHCAGGAYLIRRVGLSGSGQPSTLDYAEAYSEGNPLGGDALYRHRSAQSAGAGERGGVCESVHGVHERGGSGDAATDLFPVQIEWDDGYAWAPDRPGLGVDFDEALAMANPAPLNSWPAQLQRNDGALTNW